MKKTITLLLVFALFLGLLSSCNQTPVDSTTVPETSTEINAVLTVAGPWEDCAAIEDIGRAFTAVNPGCTIKYEYLQNYNENVIKRLTGENRIDLFFSNNIQSDSELLPYVTDLNSCEGLELSGTFDGLIENFVFREENADAKKLYAIPLGAEMRGLYVNKTLLESLNIAVPADSAALLAACETLKDAGYIPFQGNPGSFAQLLLYPWICNTIANSENYTEIYNKVESHEAGVSELFAEPFEFMYKLVENGYYDYKTCENELGLFKSAADEDCARDFLNIVKNGENYEKKDDIGQAAFMPATMSLKGVIEKTKADYHSEIEYVFIPAPVGEQGGFVYLSPARGIAMNKNSANSDACISFLNFLFTPENNENFAEIFNAIPNTKDALTYISTVFDVPADRISELGKVTFGYGFYGIISDNLLAIAKANNPYSKDDDGNSKYMVADENGAVTDENGNRFSLYPFEHFMTQLEESFQAQ